MNDKVEIKNKAEQHEQEHAELSQDQSSSSELQDTELQKELEACKTMADEWKDKYVRSIAEFENYKKRVFQDQKIWIGTAQAEILGDLLDIVDDFERAIAQQENKELPAELTVWFEGFALTHQSLQKLLNKFGVEEITQNDEFNPVYHEAMLQVDSEAHESGAVVEVMQKGYRFKGKVLRPAKVSVAK